MSGRFLLLDASLLRLQHSVQVTDDVTKFVGKISIDDDSISSVSTIDYQPCVITTAEIHRQIDDAEKNHRHVGKINRHVDVDDTESEFSEAGTTESYSDDDDERRNSIHSIPSSLTRYFNKYQAK